MHSNNNPSISDVTNTRNIGPSTHTIFEREEGNVLGVGALARSAPADKPWLVWLEDHDGILEVIGYFATLDDGWRKCRHWLGMPQLDDLEASGNNASVRTEGESTDGGPFNPNDQTHVR